MAGKLLKLAALGPQSAHRLKKKNKKTPKLKVKNIGFREIPGWSSDEVCAPLQETWVPPLVGELKILHSQWCGKKKKKDFKFYLFICCCCCSVAKSDSCDPTVVAQQVSWDFPDRYP